MASSSRSAFGRFPLDELEDPFAAPRSSFVLARPTATIPPSRPRAQPLLDELDDPFAGPGLPSLRHPLMAIPTSPSLAPSSSSPPVLALLYELDDALSASGSALTVLPSASPTTPLPPRSESDGTPDLVVQLPASAPTLPTLPTLLSFSSASFLPDDDDDDEEEEGQLGDSACLLEPLPSLLPSSVSILDGPSIIAVTPKIVRRGTSDSPPSRSPSRSPSNFPLALGRREATCFDLFPSSSPSPLDALAGRRSELPFATIDTFDMAFDLEADSPLDAIVRSDIGTFFFQDLPALSSDAADSAPSSPDRPADRLPSFPLTPTSLVDGRREGTKLMTRVFWGTAVEAEAEAEAAGQTKDEDARRKASGVCLGRVRELVNPSLPFILSLHRMYELTCSFPVLVVSIRTLAFVSIPSRILH
jgi:hypothetical protein